MELRAGAGVKLHGLRGGAHLNGMTGICGERDAASGRWLVRLETGDVKSFKAENLEIQAPGGGKRQSAAEELQDLFPQLDAPVIAQALSLCDGNVQMAAEWMILHLSEDDGPSQPPFSLANRDPRDCGVRDPGPPERRPRSVRRRAVLVGINYFGTKAELRGCINDVWNMKRLLTDSFGWDGDCMRTLVDDNPGAMPTKANINSALRWLVQGAQPGDVLFFHFSGHGAQQEDPHGYEEDGMNETICPVDFQQVGMVTDDEIGEIIIKHLPEGVRLTAIMDCCHSGTGLDLPFSWTGRAWQEETNPYHSRADVQLFSGCEDGDCSADALSSYGAAGGAMTTAFCDVLRSRPPAVSYPEFMARLGELMRTRGFSQRPQLTSSQQFDVSRPFDLDGAVPNSNATLGRIFRRRFPPRPREVTGPLADMLDIGFAMAGGMAAASVLGSVAGADGFGGVGIGSIGDSLLGGFFG